MGYDIGNDRTLYFERCWPNAELLEALRSTARRGRRRVVVTHESTKTDGSRFRNTEVGAGTTKLPLLDEPAASGAFTNRHKIGPPVRSSGRQKAAASRPTLRVCATPSSA